MATHSYNLANQSGSSFRSDLNNCLSAIASNNSNGSDPSSTFSYQWYVDTGDNTLYLRNAANDGWVAVSAVGGVGTANLGLAPTASPTFTGTADFNSNTAIKICDGTTAQRPGSPAAGMFRYNTTLSQFEGYTDAWGEIGGGGGGATGGNSGANAVFWENEQTVTHDYTLTASRGVGSFGPITINNGVSVTIPSTSTWTIVS